MGNRRDETPSVLDEKGRQKEQTDKALEEKARSSGFFFNNKSMGKKDKNNRRNPPLDTETDGEKTKLLRDTVRCSCNSTEQMER